MDLKDNRNASPARLGIPVIVFKRLLFSYFSVVYVDKIELRIESQFKTVRKFDFVLA